MFTERLTHKAPGHTEEIFSGPNGFHDVVNFVVREAKRGDYDALAGSGFSGLLVVGAACYKLGIPVIAVRKYDDHPKGDSGMVNGAVPEDGHPRVALVDDFVASGETVERTRRSILDQWPHAVFAGCIFYRVRGDVPDDTYSFVDYTRMDIARACGEEFARSIRIHARPPKELRY